MSFGKLGALGSRGGFGSLGSRGGSGTVANPLFHRSYTTHAIPASATYYNFPSRPRANEPLRTQEIIRNVGAGNIEIAYRNAGTNAQTAPDAAYLVVLTPGQQWNENGSSIRQNYLRPSVSGAAGQRYSIETTINGPVQSGTATITALTPVTGGVAVLNLAAYGTASGALPISQSKDGTKVYGKSTTSLKESTDDGATFPTTVHVFPENVLGCTETDDGECMVVTQGVASTPGKLYKSTGWTASHTAATWTLVLTSASNAYFQPWWSGGPFSFGQNAINNSGKYGIIAEYGALLTTPPDATYGTHAYVTKDYGATWTLSLDIQTNPPANTPMHTKGSVYDPWRHRYWATYDLTTDNVTYASLMYSDLDSNGDPGAWVRVTLPTEWQGLAGQNSMGSNGILPFPDRVLFGSDHADGYYVLPFTAYRTPGTLFMGTQICTHTGAQMTNLSMYRRGNGLQSFGSIAGSPSGAITPAMIFADKTDNGASWYELWRDESLILNGSGVQDVVGPTANGKFTANVFGNSRVLRGTVVQGVAGQYDQTVPFTGNGSTTVYNFPHWLGVAPTTLNAYPQNFGAVAANVANAPVVTADATNIILTFATAPTNAVVHSYALRYQ